MTNFFGEFPCTIDQKGRVLFPRGLYKKLMPEADEKFVIKKGFESCLELHPMNEWKVIEAKIAELNPYIKENRDFKRSYFSGGAEIALDASFRILIPKHLLLYANIEKDVLLFGQSNYIEIWDENTFKKYTGELDHKNLAELAERVMRDKGIDNVIEK